MHFAYTFVLAEDGDGTVRKGQARTSGPSAFDEDQKQLRGQADGGEKFLCAIIIDDRGPGDGSQVSTHASATREVFQSLRRFAAR